MAEERVERRLAAILAADVVGYSRLMGRDEAGTLARLKTLRAEVFDPEVAAHRGRIVKTTGDGVLVEFASAVDAVQCAIEVQHELSRHGENSVADRRIVLRIGINLGDIIVDGDDIHGDGVNVAARLEGLCNAGEVYVSAAVRDQVEGKIAAAFDDLGDHTVKNIDKPIRVYRVVLAARETESSGVEPGPALPLPDKPSIAVLPFANMSADPEQEYFADGISEDIITDLSKISGLFVIARNSSFAYKGQPADLRRIGRELGVRHVLEGSVRKAAGQVRVNAQLIDVRTGGHLWAERYDGGLENIFALQDEITAKIVAALEVSLTAGERARPAHAPTDDMAAYDLFMRGRAAIFPPSRHGFARARELLEDAVGRDPEFADAFALLSYIYLCSWYFLWNDEPGFDTAMETARRAVALDGDLAIGHARLGWLHLADGNHDGAVAELERAVALDPNDADSHHWLGEALNFSGEPERALGVVETAMRLSPHVHGAHLGHSYFLLGRHEEAVTALLEGKARAPGFPINYVFLAVVYIALGRDQDARTEIGNLLRLIPSLTVDIVSARWIGFRIDTQQDRYLDHLRRAGLPD